MTFYAFLQKTMTTPSRRLTGDPERFKKGNKKIRTKSLMDVCSTNKGGNAVTGAVKILALPRLA